MWLIPTRHRPHMMRALIEAMRATELPSDVAVMIDCCDGYEQIDWPDGWKVHRSDEHLEMSRSLNALFEAYPEEPWYGLVCDHARPESSEWSSALVESAGSWGIATSVGRNGRPNKRTGKERFGAATVWGGDLVREVGWVWLPDVVHLYGDDAWEDIAHGLNALVRDERSVVRNLLIVHGTMPRDSNHERLWRGQSYVRRDRDGYEKWQQERLPGILANLAGKVG